MTTLNLQQELIHRLERLQAKQKPTRILELLHQLQQEHPEQVWPLLTSKINIQNQTQIFLDRLFLMCPKHTTARHQIETFLGQSPTPDVQVWHNKAFQQLWSQYPWKVMVHLLTEHLALYPEHQEQVWRELFQATPELLGKVEQLGLFTPPKRHYWIEYAIKQQHTHAELIRWLAQTQWLEPQEHAHILEQFFRCSSFHQSSYGKINEWFKAAKLDGWW